MGNYKFKLSDMMPNAWFYKLRDMSRAKKQSNSNKKPVFSHPRRSIYHIPDPIWGEKLFNSPINSKFSDTHFPDFPRRSSTRRPRRKTVYRPSPRLSTSPVSIRGRLEKVCSPELLFSSSEGSDDDFYESPFSETESYSTNGRNLFNESSSWSSSCTCRVTSSSTDIIIDVNEKSSVSKNTSGFDSFSEIQLRPILTKPPKSSNEKPNFRKQSKKEQSTPSVNIAKDSSIKPPKQRKSSSGFRKSVSNSPRVKLKSNSPKFVNKRIRSCARNSISSSKQSCKGSQRTILSNSFAVVKFSSHPQRDFRDSMAEMIVENGISASKDLEELLACYLSLNSDEYQGVIVEAFEQIWFEMASLRL